MATALALELFRKGCIIQEIWSRENKHSRILAQKVKAKSVQKIEKMNSETDLFIIAVKDDFVSEVAAKIPGKNPFIVHTSGTVDLKELKKISSHAGVIYPLQTFTKKSKVDFTRLPILIEGSSSLIEKRILEVTKKLSEIVQRIDSTQRKKIHLAAVFVSNFPNYFYSIAETILKKEKVPFELLIPLIEQVTSNLKTSPPSSNQTGPAVRKDKKTMKRHLELLKNEKEWQKIYRSVSKGIMQHTFENKK